MAESELIHRIFSGKNRNNGAVALREQFEIDIAELGNKIHQVKMFQNFLPCSLSMYILLSLWCLYCVTFFLNSHGEGGGGTAGGAYHW
jgi:hypothetical protein